MPEKLYQSIESLAGGTPFDSSLLIRMVDSIVVRIHKKRYPFGWELLRKKPEFYDHEDRCVIRVKNFWFAAKDQDQLAGDVVIMEVEDFRESCWKKLLDVNFQESILNMKPGDDPQIIGYLYVSFNRLLQEKIYELSPGLETRVKQINRILKTQCCEADSKKGIWKLKAGSGDNDIEPAVLEDLRFVGQAITPPAMQHSSNPESERGPYILDKEMKAYLIELITRVGGKVRKKTLIDYLKEVYGIEPVRGIRPATVPEDEEGPHPIDTVSSGRQFVNQLHVEIAKKIVESMTPRQKNVYYHYIVIERTLEETAQILRVKSPTTPMNEMKKVKNYFKEVYTQSGWVSESKLSDIMKYLSNKYRQIGSSHDEETEQKVVMDLVSTLIKKEVENHGPGK
jgi:hypothetical protein